MEIRFNMFECESITVRFVSPGIAEIALGAENTLRFDDKNDALRMAKEIIEVLETRPKRLKKEHE